MKRRSFLAGATALVATSQVPAAWPASSHCLLYLGTRTKAGGQGISVCSFDLKTGKGGPVSVAAPMTSPTAFAVSADEEDELNHKIFLAKPEVESLVIHEEIIAQRVIDCLTITREETPVS